jgi:CRISPR-associated protein Cas7
MNLVKLITNPEVRHDYVIVMEGKICNPNGDPNAGNAPRQLPNNLVYATATSMSSRISTTAELMYNVKNLYRPCTNIGDIQSDYAKQGKNAEDLMRDFWDRRGNGGLFPGIAKVQKAGKKSSKKSGKAKGAEEIEDEDDSTSDVELVESGFSGVYRLYPSVALKIANQIEQAITSPVINGKDKVMGNASYVDYIVTKGTGTFNACINKKRSSIVTAEYMAQYLICLWFHAQQTASLQRGRWDIVDCVIGVHSNAYGNAQLSTIEKLVQVDVDTVKQEHTIKVGQAPSGVTLVSLSEVIGALLEAYPPAV